ncbi:MAG: glycosyltransferase family 4 protein [Candidatus Daviesbacteria bacterium]|nr:glycosyltransferase family 4 protein [Candidatus Daviesbacteria bacterium]
MNILILSWRGPGHPHAGGAEISTHEHAKGWIKAGHQVTLFTSYYIGAKKEEKVDGIKIIRQGEQVLGVHLRAISWYLFGNHPKFDIVIDQFHGIPFFTPLYVRVKKLAFIHEVAKDVWKTNFSLIPATLGEVFESYVFKLYKNIPFMTVSHSTREDLISWGIPDKNITIIHNGVTVPKTLKPMAKEKKKTIIFLGAISKDKGIEKAINVFSIINNKERDWQFWVVGKSDQPYMLKLKSLSRKLGLSSKIKFFGFISEDKKFEFLSKAHILINPSIREGWGLVVIEAARMGTPTVAFNVPGLRDSIINNKTGILCSDNSVENLAKNIFNLLENKKEYDRIRKNALLWSENFSWDKAVKKSLELIEMIDKG